VLFLNGFNYIRSTEVSEKRSAYIVRVGKPVYLTYPEGGCSSFVWEISIYLPD